MFPQIITNEFIESIQDFKIFCKLVTHMKWGGKNGVFILRDIKKSNLEECKLKGLELLNKSFLLYE